jgi:hypothetical protein
MTWGTTTIRSLIDTGRITMAYKALVGTLKLGYPLLLYKRSTHAAVFSRVVKERYVGPGHDSPQPRATTLGQQQHLTPPHGRVRCRHMSRESDMLWGITSESGPPWESVGPLYIRSGPPSLVQNLHVCEPDPWNGIQTPLCGVRATHSGVPGFQDRTYLGLNQDPGGGPVPTRVPTWSGGIRTLSHTLLLPAQAETWCCHMAYCTRRKPTGGTWPEASGLRASLHSLRISRASVHSSDRRRAQSTLWGSWYSSHVTIAGTMTHHYSCGSLPINAACTAIIMTPADYSYVTKAEGIWIAPPIRLYSCVLSALIIHIMYSFHYAPRPACRGSASLYVPPLNYKREGTQRYKGDGQYNLRIVEVGYYAPAAWTTINPRVFLCSSEIHQTCKRLGPLLILGLGQVHSSTRPEDFPSDSTHKSPPSLTLNLYFHHEYYPKTSPNQS